MFVLETQLIRSILRWDMAILLESPWYNEILKEGIEKGIKQGIEQGKQRGVQQGIERGQRDIALSQLTSVLRHRFSPLPDSLADDLDALPTERLLALFDAALEVETMTAFLACLPANGAAASSYQPS